MTILVPLALMLAQSASMTLDQIRAEPNLERRAKAAVEFAASAERSAEEAYAKGDMKSVAADLKEMANGVETARDSLAETRKSPLRHPAPFKYGEVRTHAILTRLGDLENKMDDEERAVVQAPKATVQEIHDEWFDGIMTRKKEMKFAAALAVIAALSVPALAQREFLTTSEIDQIREAQEPNARLKIYILFAKQRLDQLQQQIAKDKKGRSLAIRQLLEDYTQIIDAIDTVSDDALKRHADIAEGAAFVAEAEAKFKAQLTKIEESRPQDLEMYEVALKNAIGDTDDSIVAAKEDLGKRAQVVTAQAEKEKKEIESLTTPERTKEQKVEDAKADVGKPQRKAPTLYRPGEKPAEPGR